MLACLLFSMANDSGVVTCTVSIEEINGSSGAARRVQYRNVTLTLGRNEFKDIILMADLGKRQVKYNIREMQMHRKFVKEGKATLIFTEHRTQLLISNCPPDKLIIFLRTLYGKLECGKVKGFVSERQKLRSDLQRQFQEISPLNVKDLDTLQSKRTKEAEMKAKRFVTPKGKRKRKDTDGNMDSENKENMHPKSLKQPRKELASVLCSASILQPVRLSKEQQLVLTAVCSGKNVFFTGSAGTGKSFLMKRIIGALPPQHTFATASTGIAACHIGGTTLHAFAGIGSGKADLAQCIELASRPQVTQQWRRCHHLIIDEVSMVDGDFFDKLEAVARTVRKSNMPFGGIQLVVSGDFLQLPPVIKGPGKRKFCFQSKSWRDVIQVNMELSEVRRQTDKQFVNVLRNIRHGKCPEHVTEILKSTANNNCNMNGIIATRLCTHKEDVEQLNLHHLKKLTGTSRSFQATDTDSVYTKMINNHCVVKDQLDLKLGAQVMLAKNLDVQRGLVNGARGVVVGFEAGETGYPIVKFLSGLRETVKPVRWTLRAPGGVLVSRKQIPLQLAWAISIHKSQGMTLDCVEISLARVFESGQAYVALSRAKSLMGLRVVDFDRSCVRADPEVLRFYHRLQLHQQMLQSDLDSYLVELR